MITDRRIQRAQTVPAGRPAPHRFSVDDIAPEGRRVSAREAMTQLRAHGLGEVCSRDLEVYRLVMLPVEFKRLCVRLDQAVIDHWAKTHCDSQPPAEGLPFGADLQPAVDRERRRQWSTRPDVVSHPHRSDWAIEAECIIPGRLKLVEGREFTATGVRGRLRFRYAVRTIDGGYWLEAFDCDGAYRSLHPERVRRVHRQSKTRPAPGIKARGRR